jgi:hypothetical protein
MNYETLSNTIQAYAENTEALFVANIPVFIQQAEERVFNTINFPSLRRNVTGSLTAGNKYLSLPLDWLSTYSIAVVDNSGNYNYLLNKDVNFIREAYPNPGSANYGLPKYYSIFGPQYTLQNELSCILGPTPDTSYPVELHYFFYPPSIVQGIITLLSVASYSVGSLYTTGVYTNVPLTYVSGVNGSGANATADIVVTGGIVSSVTLQNGGSMYVVGDVLTVSSSYIGGTGSGFSIAVTAINNSTGTSWLGDNFDPVLLYGAMREAMLFMKGEQDLVKYYEDKYTEALMLAKRLGDGLERGDSYRDGQTKLNTNIKGNAAI